MHCPGCHGGDEGIVVFNGEPCPGCGHEERISGLERQLAEAQAELERRTDNFSASLGGALRTIHKTEAERDALKAVVARVEASDAEIEQSIAALFPDEFPVYEKAHGGDGVSRCVGDHVPVSLVNLLSRRFQEQKATLEQGREALKRCLTRLKGEREMIEGVELTVKLDPKKHGMDVLIPLLEAALDVGKEAGG